MGKATRNGNGRKRATSYDVAKLAGVSQSAVSRVFQQGASASNKMRDRVMSAANELGYRPNAIARGLITQRSNMVGVIILRLTNLYYPEVMVQLTQYFSEYGIRVLLFAIDNESEVETTLEQLLQYRVDGVITAALLSPEQLENIGAEGIPVVFYNRDLPDVAVSSVRCDQEEGERWLVDVLVKAGHKTFGIVSGPPDSTISVQRTSGALRNLEDHGITNVPIVSGNFGYQTGRDGFAEIVRQCGGAPDAVIAANDAMAIGCIDEAREKFGLDVPGDVSIVGFDGVGPASFAAYSLTTVRQPVGRMSKAAVSMLIERIENSELPPEKRVFTGEHIKGKSARIAPGAD